MTLSISIAAQIAYVALFVLPKYGLGKDVLPTLPVETRTYIGAAIKAIPIILLAVSAFMGQARAKSASVRSYARLMAWGLLLGACGDVFLDIEPLNKHFFVPGLVSFLVGHIFYIAAFARTPLKHAPALLVPLLAYPAVVFYVLYPHLVSGSDDMRVPVIVYGCVIALMFYFAAVRTNVPASNYMLTLLGALSFVISDSVLAIDKFSFGGMMPYAKIIVMATYYGAQTLSSAAIPSLVKADASQAAVSGKLGPDSGSSSGEEPTAPVPSPQAETKKGK